MEWIRVKDRLPDIYDFVLVFANNIGTNEPRPIAIARIVNNLGNWYFLGTCDLGAYMDIEYEIETNEITHWMPLPVGYLICF